MSETLEAQATRLAQWFDADDQDRFPTEVRYWCINEARKEIIRNNELRWGYHLTLALMPAGRHHINFDYPGGTYLPDADEPVFGIDNSILNWQKPISLWWYDAVERGVTFLEHLSIKGYDTKYPDPTDEFYRAQLSAYTTDESGIWTTPSSELTTLQIRWYGAPDDLAAGSPNNTDNFQVAASSAIFWTAMGYANDWFPGEERRDPIWEQKAHRFTDELVMQENRNRTVGQEPVKLTPGHRYPG